MSGVVVNSDGVSRVLRQPQIGSRHPEGKHPALVSRLHGGMRFLQDADGKITTYGVEASDTFGNMKRKSEQQTRG